MKRLESYSPDTLAQHLRGPGIGLRNGPFNLRLHAAHTTFARQLVQMYGQCPVIDAPEQACFDFHLRIDPPRSLRRWIRPQVTLGTDIDTPFAPFPRDHALPLFEWGYNWCIGMQAHQFLMLHAAVLEKDGLAIIMPALSGSGKSTLCAALMLRGWRLLSDEFGLLRPGDQQLQVHPLPRPIPLKNTSIAAVRDFAPGYPMGPVFPGTRKGDVAHLPPTRESQLGYDRPAPIGWVLFPQYQQGSPTRFEQLPRGWAFLRISGNSFNYRLHGAAGFETVADIVERCPARAIRYSDMEDAVRRINELHAGVLAARADT